MLQICLLPLWWVWIGEKVLTMAKPLILTAVIGGGFAFETTRLLQEMNDWAQPVYLLTRAGGTPGQHGLPLGKRFEVPMFATVTRPALWRSAYAFVTTFLVAGRVMRKEHVSTVVVVGCSHAVPMLLAAKLLRRKSVYVESLARTDMLSNTGKIVYGLGLASRFIVQWPKLRDKYPASELGTTL